ncbi:hypothetical protein AB4251_18840 [Vibrio lentus]|uniref:Uncharacterized protein n=1 Tax=Vibrio lentus TaxID=136468 RepID=A0AB36XV83_9VIBR|nr:hypothetical protein [Vibrio lentus]MCC4836777.1 hypothetical protein [Vibrio lentus]PMI16399.1 hypothetical protein BCU51_03145 [Vibrio lentus]PMK35403.1 hypothetical protein BCU02_13490 [Vibrio lentus]PMK49939.1 hypothetical protein BCT99_00570 [Vibrio lentus]PML31624.1 hypothetical protein BCT79_04410 [Vibrio lentus]
MNIIYIEDHRRPERNLEYKEIIKKLGYDNVIYFCNTVSVEHISNLVADGVICHSGMAGYDIVKHFSKEKGWPLLSYSGAVGSTHFLQENGFTKNQFSVDSDYFEFVLPEFIERCKLIKEDSK